jgi:hypothetical protein
MLERVNMPVSVLYAAYFRGSNTRRTAVPDDFVYSSRFEQAV